MPLEDMKAKDFFLGSGGMSKYEACPASGVFRSTRKREGKPWLWWGIFIHRFLEYSQTKGREAALQYIATKFSRGLKTCQRINTDSIPAGDVEIAFAHDLYARKTRQLFGTWPKAGTETYGRADLMFRDDGVPHIVDYKTGNPGDVLDSEQLLGLAIACADYCGWDGPVNTSYVVVKSTGHLVWQTVQRSHAELEAYASRSKRVHLSVMESRRAYNEEGRMPAFKLNPGCRWCELKPGCPAQPVEVKV